MWDYRVYTIRQGNKDRVIQAPSDELKGLQRDLLSLFTGYASFYPGCTARPGYSVLDNAAPHQGARILFKTDIRSFYPSITLAHLLRNIDLDPRHEWREEARKALRLCLFPVQGELVLPTGAPTSPVLSCIAATDMDHSLARIADKYGYTYTRYIDDLTFSSKINHQSADFHNRVLSTIMGHGFQYHPKKTEWVIPDSDSQFAVTGIAIEEGKTQVLKEVRRKCRARLDKIALQNVPLDKVTQGYLAYVRMIDQTTYQKLLDYLEQRKARYVSLNRYSSSPQ